MSRLIRQLIRPYRGTLIVILLAMLVETLMSLAGPWPLKIILDNVVGSHPVPKWFDHFLGPVVSGLSPGKMKLAAAAALTAVLIAVIGSIASYIDNCYTESVGHRVAHDLRMHTYHHLQRLSLAYYDSHQTCQPKSRPRHTLSPAIVFGRSARRRGPRWHANSMEAVCPAL